MQCRPGMLAPALTSARRRAGSRALLQFPEVGVTAADREFYFFRSFVLQIVDVVLTVVFFLSSHVRYIA